MINLRETNSPPCGWARLPERLDFSVFCFRTVSRIERPRCLFVPSDAATLSKSPFRVGDKATALPARAEAVCFGVAPSIHGKFLVFFFFFFSLNQLKGPLLRHLLDLTGKPSVF